MSYQSAVLTEQESAWLSEVAGRLRLIQADAASSTSQERREFLGEQLTRSLQKTSPGDRKRYLEALLARFPVGGELVRNTPTESAPAAAPAPAPAPPPETFDQLFERLLKAVPELDEKKKAEVTKRLGEVGLARVDKESLVLEIGEELRQSFRLPPGQQPRLTHLVRLCILLVTRFQGLDQAALEIMKVLAPRSVLLKRPQEFSEAATQFVLGQTESVEPHVRMAVDLLTALLKATVDGSRDFARQYIERLSPPAIDDVVTAEGGGSIFGKSKKERCWERYVLLSREFETADLISRRLRDCMGAYVEKKVKEVSGGR